MSEHGYTEQQSSPFIAALKQSYRKSLARVHQATLSLHARQSVGNRPWSEKICRAFKHVKIFAIFSAGMAVAMVGHGPACVPACSVNYGLLGVCERFTEPTILSLDLQAPWALAALEVAVMTVLYVILQSSRGIRPWHRIHDYQYRFSTSLEDILLLTYARFLGVLLAYLLGSGQRMMRCA